MGYTFHVEYSRAGQQEGHTWAFKPGLRRRGSSPTGKRGLTRLRPQWPASQDTLPLLPGQGPQVQPLAQQIYLSIFRGKNCYEMYVLSNFRALAWALFLVIDWKNISHSVCTYLKSGQWFQSPLRGEILQDSWFQTMTRPCF